MSLEPIEQELEDERQLVHELETLLEHPGWRVLRSIMTSQERLRRNEILTGSHNGLDGLINRDKLISELAGINTVMNLPNVIIDDSKTKIGALLEALEDINGAASIDGEAEEVIGQHERF